MIDKENSPKRKILLAEDDSSMRRFLEITLHRADYDVVSAEDGLSAMQFALAEEFDAVVTDAVMPHMTGHDLCRVLRQKPTFENTPMIILSGLEQEISTNTEHDCADSYLVKNENLKTELITKLEEILDEKANN